MSKRKPPADPYPSAAVLRELEGLTAAPAGADRGRRAWAAVLSASGNADFHAVLDYAVENGLTAASEDGSDIRGSGYPVWTNPIDGSEMVWVPAGRFRYGDGKGAEAECGGFSLARCPVTNARFRRFLAETSYTPPDDHPENELFLSHWGKAGPKKGTEEHPVTFVSLVDACTYCRWAGLTLPTEWLWEKAARGTDGRVYPWGAERPTSKNKLAHVYADKPCPVGKHGRTRSPYGCQDMVGNVSEWCLPGDEDDPGRFPPSVPSIPIEEGALAPVRGACYLRTEPGRMAASHRRFLSVTRRNRWVGFRPGVFLPCHPPADPGERGA